ncbi:A disintegrin and metalloproteinase with thrombospondin motifs adt-1-like isoform X3 [Lineus longissimus]|uniref:A disintegrin and metalloproteinase with thrombospondin motifs adt-1-like isoform X3 n=1 Tax=Lineus longissimus TaxID=88925 RepID=UPI002B4EFCF7
MRLHRIIQVLLIFYIYDVFQFVAGSSQLSVGDETVHNPLLKTKGLYEIVQKDAAGKQLPGKQLPLGYVYRTVDGLGLATQCFYECRMDPQCKSFTHNERNGSCFLNSNSFTEVTPVDALDGITCYDGDSFSIPGEALGSCAQVPCKNGGICLDKYDEDTEKKDYECVCPDEWSGRTCETQAGVAVWEDWKPWGDCSVSCGTGYKERTRRCIDSLTKEDRNEQECWGCSLEIQLCTLKPCPVWEVWSTWSDCSTNRTCGPGIKTRTRTCRNGGTIDKDPGCFGRPTENVPCESPTCQTIIRLDGSSNYGEGRVMIYNDLDQTWGQVCGTGLDKQDADVLCHQVGLPRAAEVVTGSSFGISGDPFFLGNPQCDGTEPSIQRCQHSGWSTNIDCHGGPAKIKCAVNGAWNCWSEWDPCSVTCADGIRTRTRLCDDPPNLNGGAVCPGARKETLPCNPGDCPVDGQWYPWLAWSECSKNCGGGRQTRTRSCKQPENGGMICIGSASEEQDCQTQPCPIDCTWKEWQNWGPCNATCGTGYMTRTRGWNEAKYNGKACEGESIEAAKCNEDPCPVDGYWKQWGDWQQCDKTCGGGKQSRTRKCKPEMYGGKPCQGSATEERNCAEDPCPVDGYWKPWTDWTDCSVSCGGGTQNRSRECVPGKYGGSNCSGEWSETRVCGEKPCPVDGVWEKWQDWSTCTVSCDGGTKGRVRGCSGPLHGGKNCTGPWKEEEACGTTPCPVSFQWTEYRGLGVLGVCVRQPEVAVSKYDTGHA